MGDGLSQRLYLIALSLAVVALLLTRLFVLPHFGVDGTQNLGEIASSVLDSLIAAGTASLMVSVLVLIVFRPNQVQAAPEAEVILASQVGPSLRTGIPRTSIWNYRGHTGRYLRAVILPLLAKESAQAGRYISMCVQVLDPDEPAVIDFLVSYRREGEPQSNWTQLEARAEIAATLVSLATVCAAHPRLESRLFLSKSMSPYTVDISSDLAVVSRSRSSALRYTAGSTFYQSAVEDVQMGFMQSRELPPASVALSADPSIAELVAAISALGVLADATPELLQMVKSALKHPINHYGN